MIWTPHATVAAIVIAGLGDQLRSPLVLQCIKDYQSGRRLPLDLIHNPQT